jgi:hypothetical protein
MYERKQLLVENECASALNGMPKQREACRVPYRRSHDEQKGKKSGRESTPLQLLHRYKCLTYGARKRVVCDGTAQSDIGGLVLPLRQYVRRVASLDQSCVVGV